MQVSETTKQKAEAKSVEKPKGKINPKVVILFILLAFTYTAMVNTVYTYTATYNMSLGFNESVSVTMLTMFSIGTMVGSLIFTWVLKYFRVTSVMFFNCVVSFVIFQLIRIITAEAILLPGYFAFGSLFGVVYSFLVSASTEMMPSRASFAAAMVAFCSGSADILSPLITGQLVNRWGIGMSFQYGSFMGTAMVILVTAFYFVYARAGRRKQYSMQALEEE